MQLLYPTRGTARILGRPVGDVATRRRIGFLAENPYFYDYLTAEELLSYFARLFGYAGADVAARVRAVLDDVGLGAERRMRLRQFSKGMVQRVGLAQALINDPEVVFLDEPMSGLDPLGRRDVRELILRLRERGCTVFFSSHILSDAEALCSRVAVLAQGRLRRVGHVSRDPGVRAARVGAGGVGRARRGQGRPRGARAPRRRPSADGRFTLDLPPDIEPEPPDRTTWPAQGATVVSLNPVRDTLEDYFVHVGRRRPAPRDTGARVAMRRSALVAGAVFRESVRDRVPYNLVRVRRAADCAPRT